MPDEIVPGAKMPETNLIRRACTLPFEETRSIWKDHIKVDLNGNVYIDPMSIVEKGIYDNLPQVTRIENGAYVLSIPFDMQFIQEEVIPDNYVCVVEVVRREPPEKKPLASTTASTQARYLLPWGKMRCLSCGKKTNRNVKFCGHCGKTLHEPATGKTIRLD